MMPPTAREIKTDDSVVTLEELAAVGLSRADVPRCCPAATEYVGLDRQPVWKVAELEGLAREVRR